MPLADQYVDLAQLAMILSGVKPFLGMSHACL